MIGGLLAATLIAGYAQAGAVSAQYRGNSGLIIPTPPSTKTTPPSSTPPSTPTPPTTPSQPAPPTQPATPPSPSDTPPSGSTPSTPVITLPAFAPGGSSSWFNQIGLNSSIEAQANQGYGVSIAFVDTGVVASNAEIAGRVSSASSCAAVTFSCSNGYYDDNGHGTATASIAAGQYGSGDRMSGVAPMATILSEKVLNASGSGYDTDVANGLIKAADAGAQVINLSLTYVPTAAEVNAINYATSKGSVIVWAAGNGATALNGGASTAGLTATSLSHLVFVGSVNSSNSLSSFSNTPGGGFASAGSTSVSYAQLWLMAPGEGILAPGVQYGANAYASWTGTSMSAPEVAGAIALLEATWPVLQRNGTATAVLFSTATDLGAKGVDSTYGNGLLNVAAAFQPIGGLTVNTVSGQSLPLSSVRSAVVSSSALGAMPAVRSMLSSYTTFDAFQRNFTSNLSGMIINQRSLAMAMASQAAPPVEESSVPIGKTGRLTLALSDTSGFDDFTPARRLMLNLAGAGSSSPAVQYLSLSGSRGSILSVGKGLPATASFASAMWGEHQPAAAQAGALGVSNALMGLAQGGGFAAIGADVTRRTRLAIAWSSAPTPDAWGLTYNPSAARSSSVSVGMTFKLSNRLTAGATVTSLVEKNGLLGASYDVTGPLSLGSSHRSSSVGFATTYNLGGGRSLLLDAVLAKTSGAAIGNGLISSVTPLVERAYGASFSQTDAFRRGDRLTLSAVRPLKVVSGSAQVLVTTVDDQGYATPSLTRASLRPDGAETDFGVRYDAAPTRRVNLTTGVEYRADAFNMRGVNELRAHLSLTARF